MTDPGWTTQSIATLIIGISATIGLWVTFLWSILQKEE